MEFEVEVITDGGVAGGKLLQSLDISNSGVGPFPSSERLVQVFCSIIQPAPAPLAKLDLERFEHCPIRCQAIGHDDLRAAIPRNRTSQRLKRCLAVSLF